MTNKFMSDTIISDFVFCDDRSVKAGCKLLNRKYRLPFCIHLKSVVIMFFVTLKKLFI